MEDITPNIDCPVVADHTLEQCIINSATKVILHKNPSRKATHFFGGTKPISLGKIALKCYDVYRANTSPINKIIYHGALAKIEKYFQKAKAAMSEKLMTHLHSLFRTSFLNSKASVLYNLHYHL